MSPLRFAVLGSPVAHSKSPTMHGAAYRALGLPHVYEKLETRDDELPARLDSLRRGDYAGFNVTVPHKTRALALADERDASAEATGAANTLVRTREGRVRAYNTDAPALADELAALAGSASPFAGKSAVVLGTGGAARAAVFALGRLGIARVEVRGRTARPELASVLAAAAPSAAYTSTLLVAPPAEVSDLVAIVQASSAGMTGANAAAGESVADAVAWASVPPSAVAYDVVYVPPRTPFVARAEARSLACASGLGMLVRQGALAFELWLGVAPPLDVMRSALEVL
jgi:shikimate dehydrogenase